MAFNFNLVKAVSISNESGRGSRDYLREIKGGYEGREKFFTGGPTRIRQMQMKYLAIKKMRWIFFVLKALDLNPIMMDKVRFLYCCKVFVIYQPLLNKIVPKA